MPHPPHRRSGERRNRPAQGRRKAPQDATGEESRYLEERSNSGRRLAIELIDGSHNRGTVRSFNENTIELETEDRPIVVRKSQIRYIEELD